ncbi:MAG: hypothetical protein LBR27_03850, partial [Bifidobacteriaceae bacterium]|nr:hypothetical protein [Bifidobacteriaceae bacterium]
MSPFKTRLAKSAVAGVAAAAMLGGGFHLPAQAAVAPAATVTPAAADTVHFSKQPVERSTYARHGTMRLSVQAESTEGLALSYQWKWSTSQNRSNPQNVTGLDGSEVKAVLTATVSDTPGTYYYWVEVTDGTSTVPSQTATVVVLDEIIADTYTVGEKKADGSAYTQADYDKYYMKNIKLMGATGTTTGSNYEWAGNQLYTSLQ